MNWLVIGLALLLAAGGGYSAFLGLDINQVEHGWAQLIAGAVFLSGSAITFALAGVMFKLDRLSKASRSPAVDVGPHPERLPETLPLPSLAGMSPARPLPPLPGIAAGVAAAGATAAVAVAHSAWAAPAAPALPASGESDLAAGAEPDAAAEPAVELARHVPPELLPPTPSAQEAALEGVQEHAPSVEEPEAETAPPAATDLLDGDWLQQALAGKPEDIHPVSKLAHDVELVVQQDASTEPASAPAEPQQSALEHEVAREMSYSRAAGPDTAMPAPEPAAPPDASPVIARYQAGGVAYTMFADGSIDADDGTSLLHFTSMEALKAHMSSVA